MCACGFCQGCCGSSDECVGPRCPRSNCQVLGLKLCGRGFCSDCCNGCDTCEGPECPKYGLRGRNICDRGFVPNAAVDAKRVKVQSVLSVVSEDERYATEAFVLIAAMGAIHVLVTQCISF